ncbi:PAS domain S-box protein [Paucibacter sp. PLA-PC-4]|uniref:PAS domain S-box protein n=1 Tax=Paucibacter sp. PLA-PC-4 TaxID=2993655 RepID=UPI0022493556|nr:PAS domain S-box protein [Paucibacter sp. PLA-PC-4]MCX2860780.1 PAS domain S-box protein [Paucibacter sp. PLA-PC-4]
MRRRGYLFRQLLWLTAAVAVPLLALLAYNVQQDAVQARTAAYQAVENYAAGVAQDARSLLSATESYLAFMADRPLVRAVDEQTCDPLLDGVVQRRQHFANVFVTDLSGRPVCSSIKGPGVAPTTFAHHDWFKEAAKSDALALSKPFLAPIAQRTVAAMSLPLRDAARRRTGTVTVLLDLESLQRDWDRYSLPPGSRLTLFDSAGTIMVTRPGFGEMVGKDASAILNTALTVNPSGIGIAPGVDGVERAFALKSIRAGGWQAAAAIPASDVFAGYRAQVQRSIVVGSIVVLAVLAFAVAMARRMSAPLAALARTARAVASGDLAVRATASVPGEFGLVASEFNAMLDARQVAEAELHESERRYADLLANVEMVSLMLDTAGHVTYCNDYLLSLAGYSREELTGADWMLELVPPECRDIREVFAAAMNGGVLPRHVEHEIVTRSAGRRLVQWHNSVLRSTIGEIVGMASLGVDITEVRLAQIRERRHTDFYTALSRTNGAIVRMSDPQTLYQEICRICVEHGHASIAYVSLVDGDLIRPAAWSGPADAFLRDFAVPLDVKLPAGRGLTAEAFRSGIRQVSNNYEDDPRTLPWRERARAIGTQAAATFPFRRGGKTIGTLSLHMTIGGFFDDRLIGLVEEMTGDVSFALDNFDRERARAVAEHQAESDSQRFRTLFQTAPAAMSIVSLADQRLLDINEAFQSFAGLTRQEIIGRDAFEEGLWPGDQERADFVREFRDSGRVRNFQMRGTDHVGKQRDYLLQADRVEFAEQACVLTIASDVTELRDAQRMLNDREKQLSGLVETAMDAIISIDSQHRVRLFNRAAAELFQVSELDAMDSNIERFIPSRLRGGHMEHVNEFARFGSTARRMGGLHTLAGLRADGTEFPIEASISRLCQDDSVLMTVVIRDATEMRRAEQGRLAQAAAESASLAKSEFLSRMSHELRTPLNAVLGFSQLLQSDVKDPLSASHQNQIDHIRRAGWHLLALVNDVLDVSKIEAGKVDVEESSVDVPDLLDEVVRISEPAASQLGVVIATTYRRSEGVLVWADPRRLRQVMINLLSNATKYNRPGGRVEIGISIEEDQTHIDVQDTGIGMSAKQMAHLYEPFNRLGRESIAVEGTGLGLALTKQLVQLMHGRLDITSEEGLGTRVRVTMPSHDSIAPSSAFSPLVTQQTAVSDESLPTGVVLYIEDNPVNLLLVEQLLLRWPGVVLAQAENGMDGIALARTVEPDLILLDMRLPDMDGVAVLAALSGEGGGVGCPVIALSASAMPDEVGAARKAGAFDYWTKPLDFEHFLREMRRLLRSKREVE